jgi:hypothetical protein
MTPTEAEPKASIADRLEKMAYIDEDKIWCYRGFIIEAIIADLRVQEKALQEAVKQVEANLYDLGASLQEYPGSEIRQAILKRAIIENEWFLSILAPATPKAPEGETR